MNRIGRYENPYLNVEFGDDLPDGASTTTQLLVTEDAAACHGFLYQPAGHRPRTVIAFMHPRADFTRHYAVPILLRRGLAVWTQNSRSVGNDTLLVHERVLLDVAAGIRRLREIGFEYVVLCGNSGGGSLYTFYVSQAHAPAGGRLLDLATGERFDLNRYAMPRVDAVVYLAAHPGEGHFLLSAIDASVVDESDPLSCDPALDMYDPRNGFRPPPESSSYEPPFLERLRGAQRARVAKIDARARQLVEQRQAARRRAASSAGDLASRRESMTVPIITVYRTNADPRYADLRLDPSQRSYGDLWSLRPDLFNWGPVGFARTVSPDAWLSTWSALSSRAEVAHNAPTVDVPALLLSYTADNAIFPSDARLVFDSIGTTDKQAIEVAADHYGLPIPGGPEKPREQALNLVADWLAERFAR
jgi:hypothetical protein